MIFKDLNELVQSTWSMDRAYSSVAMWGYVAVQNRPKPVQIISTNNIVRGMVRGS
jgi:hypothetical protein